MDTKLAKEVLGRVESLIMSAKLLLPIQLPSNFGVNMALDLTSFQEHEVHNVSVSQPAYSNVFQNVTDSALFCPAVTAILVLLAIQELKLLA